MARDFLTIGPTPVYEECTPACTNREKEVLECFAFAHQLKRQFPTGTFIVETFPYNDSEVSCYNSVVAMFNTDEAEDNLSSESSAAFAAESSTPGYWDVEAIKELASKGVKVKGVFRP